MKLKSEIILTLLKKSNVLVEKKKMLRMRQMFIVTLISISISIYGCVSTGQAKQENSQEKFLGTTVYLSSKTCTKIEGAEVAPVIMAIAAVILPIVIEKGVVFISEIIKDEGKKFSATFNGQTNGNLYEILEDGESLKIKPNYNCLVLARGLIGNPESEKVKNDLKDKYPFAIELSLASEPLFYMESILNYAPKKSTGDIEEKSEVMLSIDPHILVFNESSATYGDKKDIIITWEFDFPAQIATGGKAGNFSMVHPPFEDFKEKTNLKVIQKHYSTKWNNLPVPTQSQIETQKNYKEGLELIKNSNYLIEQGEKIIQKAGTLSSEERRIALKENGNRLILEGEKLLRESIKKFNSGQKLVGNGDLLVPFTLKATIIETDKGKGQEVFNKISDTIKESSKEIAKIATKKILPDDK